MQQAVLDKLAILTHFNELIATPVPEPELSAFKAIRESMKGWLLAEITALTATPLGASKVWKEILTGIAAAGLGYVIEKIVGGVFGKILGPIGHILADPSTISGVDTEIIDTLIVRNPPDNCYKITWYRTRWPVELMWGPVRMKVEQIPCGG
ncbi:MAG: hypothetical protein ABI830_01000 [Pseudolabrys sp.]